MSRVLLGVDVGGSSIKLARVDVERGATLASPARLVPPATTPAAVIDTILASTEARGTIGPIGFAFPAVVRNGIAMTAANVDPGWIGQDAGALVTAATGRECLFINDADAAGVAEMQFGAGRGLAGVVFVLTFGTGIGSAPFVDGRLLPNTELGHLSLPGIATVDAENYASARIKTELGLDWPAWAERVNRYLAELQRLFWPEAFIIGGAVSEQFDAWGPLLRSPARILPARLGNAAGVIGAALAAARRFEP